MTMDDTNFEITTSQFPSTVINPDKPTTNSYNATSGQGHGTLGVRVASGRHNNQTTINVDQKEQSNALTLIDSGASDHCFVDKTSFMSLNTLCQPTIGLATSKESTFNVLGKGKARIKITVNGITRMVTLDDALYIPGLRSNLISVSKLVEKGTKVNFDDYKATVRSMDNTIVMTAKQSGHLYAVKTECDPPTVLTTQTKMQAVPFDTWHRRLGHTAVKTIHEMASKNLVDGMAIAEELTMRGRCEDCIFDKHSTHLFNNNIRRETETLERIYIDIWGPSPTQSAGGVQYFMLVMDGFSSYKTVAFLRSKSADVTLNVLKAYHIEAECQTGKKLKSIRLDMRREWYNKAWKAYRKKYGLVFEFTTPCAH